ncbi:MAG: SMC-Scp complex subunit ScpB [Deltaproteobacteria bacterium]|nr:MAG: SMC-Scp complex subunit ScpB [Deltaproteobacteria bacterium]
METKKDKAIIESLIFVSKNPITIKDILKVLDKKEGEEEIKRIIDELIKDYSSNVHGIEIVEVAEGYQFRTKSFIADWIKELKKVQPIKISRAAIETLSIIAYKQPIMKVEIDQIRGVDSTHVIRFLLEKRLIKILGRKNLPGRPMVYGTTKEFLELFGFKDLKDLPPIEEIKDIIGNS